MAGDPVDELSHFNEDEMIHFSEGCEPTDEVLGEIAYWRAEIKRVEAAGAS